MKNFLIGATTEINQSITREGTQLVHDGQVNNLTTAVANWVWKTLLSEIFKEQRLEMIISLLEYSSYSLFSAFTQG